MSVIKLLFLSAEEIVAMHDELLRRYGGAEGGGHRGPVDYAGVEAAASAVKNSYYEDVADLAAAYAVYIVQGHVFQDGNKRAGAAAMLTFLYSNEVRTDLGLDDLSDLMVELQRRAEAGERTDALVNWLASFLSGT